MNEFELISRLTRSLPTNPSVVVGPGDDCAVLDVGLPDRLLLFKTDAVVESIHFKPGTPREKIGHKALARCLSDIAAMAGTPSAALVTIALPRTFEPGYPEAIYAGINDLARQHGVAIVGGETTTNPAGTLISIALLGFVQRGKAILRSGAEPGDAIFVTGELGGSLAGKHLEFEPRLAEARWLAQHFQVHAMLDVSDGLAGDLRHHPDRQPRRRRIERPLDPHQPRGPPRRQGRLRRQTLARSPRSPTARTSSCCSPLPAATPCRCWIVGASNSPTCR